MDDVIFSGTNTRPARNNAEVAIQIDNRDRKAPAQFNEHDTLDISRRIERETGLDLPHQRPRSARPRRADFVRRRLDRRRARRRWCIKAASARSSRPSPSSAAACSKRPPAFPACMRAATRPSCGCKRRRDQPGAARGRHRPARRPDRRAQAPGAAGGALPQRRRPQVRKAEATLFHLRWIARQCRSRRSRARQGSGVRVVADAHRRAGGGLHAPGAGARRRCRRCAKPRRRPPPRCSGC